MTHTCMQTGETMNYQMVHPCCLRQQFDPGCQRIKVIRMGNNVHQRLDCKCPACINFTNVEQLPNMWDWLLKQNGSVWKEYIKWYQMTLANSWPNSLWPAHGPGDRCILINCYCYAAIDCGFKPFGYLSPPKKKVTWDKKHLSSTRIPPHPPPTPKKKHQKYIP